MITTNGNTIFESGSIVEYDTPNIVVVPTYYPRTGDVLITLRITPSASPDLTSAEVTFRTTKTDIDAKTGTGTGDTAKYLNAIEQVVKDMLLVLNPSVTFTIV